MRFAFRAGAAGLALASVVTAFGLLSVTPAVRAATLPPTEPAVSLFDDYTATATLQKAEENYRARRLDAAMEQFGMIAAMDDHPFAWLRIGNICHRRGDVSGAFDAYRRARQAASGSPQYAQIRAQAIMNLALLGLDQAQLALEDLGTENATPDSRRWAHEVRLRLGELNNALTPPETGTMSASTAPLVAMPAASSASGVVTYAPRPAR